MSYFGKKKPDFGNISQVKASVSRGIRCKLRSPCLAVYGYGVSLLCYKLSLLYMFPAASICEQYPYLVETGVIDVLIPKKATVLVGKWCVALG